MLAMDIGNSNLRLVRFAGDEIAERSAVAVERIDRRALEEAFRRLAPGFRDGELLWIASVVPPLNESVAETAERFRLLPRFIASAKDRIMPHALDAPQTTGVDRLLSALAAWRLVFEPGKTGGVVVQCGSAATVDWVDPEGVFRGGHILPGPKLWLKGLAHAAQLPEFSAEEVEWDRLSAGGDTRSAMLRGLAAALPGAVRAAVGILRDGLPRESPVVLTGGWAEPLSRRLGGIPHSVKPDLPLAGIREFVLSQGLKTA